MMKNPLLLILMACSLLTSCGGDNSDPAPAPNPPTPEVTPPVVTTTVPADGATNIAVGTVNVTLTYSQDIRQSADAALQPVVTGGTLAGPTTASGKNLAFAVSCPDYETLVTITIPKGLVSTAGALADAYQFSFTTMAETKPLTPNIATQPVAATTDAAKRLYAYLLQQYGRKTISSVMAEWNWNHTVADRISQSVGKYPAMNCYDFIHIYVPRGNGWIDYTDITPVKEWADAGGIVSLMWHFNVPKSETSTITSSGGGVTYSPTETTFKAGNALIEGTWEHQWFYQEMEKVANVILQLQDQGIAAVWRPFHEAAGNATAKQQANWTKAWFWWGSEGADTYKKLWQAMYDYFQQKGIANLLWVWTTQNYNGNSSGYHQDTDWYPGNDRVDIVARDLYGSTAAQNLQEFTEIQAAYPTKMVVLGECGTDTGRNTPFAPIADVLSAGAQWGWFMGWCGDNLPVADWWKSALTNPNVITRDQVPSLK